MDVTMFYILTGMTFLLFLTGLVTFMFGYENIITISGVMISSILSWRLGNACIDGTLTKLNEVTGLSEVIREQTAASVFHWLGMIFFIAFVIQVLAVIKNSKSLPED